MLVKAASFAHFGVAPQVDYVAKSLRCASGRYHGQPVGDGAMAICRVANLAGADLSEADLSEFDLSWATLDDSDFYHAFLWGALTAG